MKIGAIIGLTAVTAITASVATTVICKNSEKIANTVRRIKDKKTKKESE